MSDEPNGRVTLRDLDKKFDERFDRLERQLLGENADGEGGMAGRVKSLEATRWQQRGVMAATSFLGMGGLVTAVAALLRAGL